jgi:hypothetical protein
MRRIADQPGFPVAFGLLLLEESGVRAVDDQRPRPKKDRGEGHEHPDDDERYQEMPGQADLARAVAVAHPSDDAAAPKRAPTSRRLTARHLDGHGPSMLLPRSVRENTDFVPG